jgi:hypothetical protein
MPTNPIAGTAVLPFTIWRDWDGSQPTTIEMEIDASAPNNLQYLMQSRGLDVDGFGAYGDGDSGSPHDDTLLIQNAITTAASQGGGAVLLGPRTYRIASTLYVPSNVVLVGRGRNLSILKYTGTGTAVALQNGTNSPATLTNGAGVFNLQILGTVSAGIGLDLSGSQYGTFFNLLITGFTNQGSATSGVGLQLKGVHNNATASVPCQNNKLFGVDVVNCHVGLDAAASDVTQTDCPVQYNEFSCCNFIGASTSSPMYCGIQLRERAKYNTFSNCTVLYAQVGGKLIEIRDQGNTFNAPTLAQSAANGVDFITTTTTPSGNTFEGGVLDQSTITTNPAWNDSTGLSNQIGLGTGSGSTSTNFANSVSIRGGGTGLSVTNAVSIGGNLSVGGTLSITGNVSLGGTLTVTGTITGPIVDKGGMVHNPLAYGAKGDTRRIADAQITASSGGSTTVTSNSLTAADIGKWINIVIDATSQGGTVAPRSFAGPITAVNTGTNPHQATVTGAANISPVMTAVSPYCTVGTDDSAVFQTVMNLGGMMELPAYAAFTLGDLNWPQNLLKIAGNGAQAYQKQVNHNIISNALNLSYAHVREVAFTMTPGDEFVDNNNAFFLEGSSHGTLGATNQDQGYILIEDCDFNTAQGYALQIFYAKYARVINCNFYNCPGGGQIGDSYDSLYDGNIYQGTQYTGWHTPVAQSTGHQSIPFAIGAAELTVPTNARSNNVVIRNCIVSDADNCEAFLIHDGLMIECYNNLATDVIQGISCFPVNVNQSDNLRVCNVTLRDNDIYLRTTSNNQLGSSHGIRVGGGAGSTSFSTTRASVVGNRIWNSNQALHSDQGFASISIGDYVNTVIVKNNEIYDPVGLAIQITGSSDRTSLQELYIIGNIIKGLVKPSLVAATQPAGISFANLSPTSGIIANNVIGDALPTTTVGAGSNGVLISSAPTTLTVGATSQFFQEPGVSYSKDSQGTITNFPAAPRPAYVVLSNGTLVEFTYTGTTATTLTGCANWTLPSGGSLTGLTLATGNVVTVGQYIQFGIVVDGNGSNITDLTNVVLGSNSYLPSITTQIYTVGSGAFPPIHQTESFNLVGIQVDPTVALDVVGQTSFAGISSLGGPGTRSAPMYFSGNEITASVRNGSLLPGGFAQGDGYYTTDPQYKTTAVWPAGNNKFAQSNAMNGNQWFQSGLTALPGQGADPYGAATLNLVTISSTTAILSEAINTTTFHGHTLVVSFWAMLRAGGQTSVAYRVVDDSNAGADVVASTHYESQLNTSTLKRIQFTVNVPNPGSPNPTNQLSIRLVDSPGAITGDGTIYLWRAQVEDMGVGTLNVPATPYMDNPALIQNQRPGARVGIDGTLLSRTQTVASPQAAAPALQPPLQAGSPSSVIWASLTFRSNFKGGTIANGGTAPGSFCQVLHWRSSSNSTAISLYYKQIANTFELDVADVGGGSISAFQTAPAFNPGDIITVTFFVSAFTQLGISVNGAAFSTIAMASSINSVNGDPIRSD